MSRTSRLYVIVICSVVFFLFTGWIVNTYIINPTFRSLEEKQAAEQASRAMASIKQDAGQVSALLSDWSTWDASYQFAKDRNALFIDENLRDWHSIEKDMHINLIYIYNRTGKKIYGRTYYGKKDLPYELPDFANDSILTSDFIQGVKLHGGRRTGILATNNGLMILVARPILKTDGQGPSSGVMIFGRFFDEARIDQISEEMNINFSVLLIQKSQLKGSERTVKNSLTPGLKKIVYLNDKELMLYELLIDVYGNQIGLLRTHVTTDLISMAQQVSVKIVVVMGIFMFALILIVLYSVKMKEGIRTDKRRPVNVGVIIVIGTGLIVTIALSGLLYEKKQREKQGSFRKLAQTQIAAVKNKLTDDLRELWEIKRFFDVSENVTREEFKRFVLPYMQNENFQAIEWIPEVHGEERNIYESAAKKDGFVNFTFTELGENKQLVRSVERPIYYPVFYVEPVQNNLSAVGYAPVHLPMRDEAIQRADSTGDASITGPFRLVQETGNQKGLMVFLPVKKSNPVVSGNKKVDCRKSFIACVYRVDDMLKSTRMTSVSENLFIELKDISYRHHEVLNQGKPIQLDDSDYVQHVEFGFAGRNYKISIAANSMFFDAHNDYEYVFVLLGGFLVTMFVSLYFHEILTQKERAEFLVDSRTKDLQESEERYQTFITQSTEGICRIEMNLAIPLTDISDTATGDLLGLGYYAECNDVYAAQMGYDNTSELVGKKANEILPFFGETFGLLYGDFFRNGFRLIDSEIQVVNAKGETKVFTENILGIIENGCLIRIWGNQSDITAKKAAEKALKESEEHFRTLAENSPEIIIRFDKDLRITYTNSIAKKLTSIPLIEVIGQSYKKLDLPLELMQVLENSIRNVIVLREPYRVEFMLENKIWIDWLLFPEFTAGGEVKEVISIARDITGLKNVEEELRNAKDRAEESDRLKSAFLANMSHEIRTPMNAIMGFSELLDEDDISVEDKKYFIQKLRRRTTDLLNLINDILDISKIEAAQIQLYEVEFDVRQVLVDMRDVFSGLQVIEKKPIEFTIDCDIPADETTVIMDKNRLKQILINLINNAFKFTAQGSIILSCTKTANRHLKFIVSDSGIGISKEKLESVFDRFRQGDDESFSKKFGGTGLGLAIVKGLLEKMGGTVSLESEIDKGTTITLTFPFRTNSVFEQNLF